MGAILTKNQPCAINYAQLIEESNLARILKEEHSEILAEDVFYSRSISMSPENICKNRYQNAFCFDHNRVILPAEDGESDFINASHVDGHNVKGRFICCQAPIQETVQDFYRMVFAFQTRVIVMLTKIAEGGQERCVLYWSPKEGTSVVYGRFTVKTMKIKTFRHHAVTKLRVTDDNGASLYIKHFAYTDWPVNRVPQNPTDFLNFILLVRKAQLEAEFDNRSENFPPMVVHCSAGLNRTGTFCAVDICLSRYDERSIISLASVVRNLRKQRSDCLSSPEQYVFCYQIMLQYVKSIVDKA